METSKHPSSFRDPSGFVFKKNGNWYRQINIGYKHHYEHLIESNLYRDLANQRWLIPHDEVELSSAFSDDAFKVLKPENIPFISYPYEWCFSQLKAAALLTLKIQKIALEHQMTLKDATAFNIQFLKGQPIWIDTLSFAVYKPGAPWIAYTQFCENFLAPLSLLSYADVRLHTLFRTYLNGIPLQLATRLLPLKSKFNLGLLLHLNLQQFARSKFIHGQHNSKANMSITRLQGLIEHLQTTIEGLKPPRQKTLWGNYNDQQSYTQDDRKLKTSIVKEWLEQSQVKTIWDLGANKGTYSRLAAREDRLVIAWDQDPQAVQQHYQYLMQNPNPAILPLILDLTNPSPALGWHLKERDSFLNRGPADLLMALALVHHLAITHNIPLQHIASIFHNMGTTLILEFVAKEDKQVQEMLSTREDIFKNYSEVGLEDAFKPYFEIQNKVRIGQSQRTLYLMRAR